MVVFSPLLSVNEGQSFDAYTFTQYNSSRFLITIARRYYTTVTRDSQYMQVYLGTPAYTSLQL